MTLHFPDEVETNVLTIDATDPKSGTAEFKASAIRVDRSRTPSAPGRPHRSSRCRRSSIVDLRLATARRRRPSATRSTPCSGRPRSAWDGASAAPTATRPAAATSARERHLLLPALHAVQSRVGWISPAALGYVCRRLTIPPAEAYGVASFYALFALEPRAAARGHVCTDLACMAAAAPSSSPSSSAPSARPASTPGTARIWLESPCLGLCERAPAALVTSAGEHAARARVAPGDRDRRARPRSPARPRRAARRRCVPQAGERVRSGSSAASGGSTRRASTATAPQAATRRCGAASSSGPPASSAR